MNEIGIFRSEDAASGAFDRVPGFLREQFLAGGIRPGDRLAPERELSLQLGVSRPVLREALRALAMIGVVEIRHGVGTVVRRPDVSALGDFFAFALAQRPELGEDVMEARIAIECQAIRLACSRASVAEHPPAGRLIVDMSTIAAQAVRNMNTVLRGRGIGFVDAPVSGGVAGAKARTLSIMAGGEPADFARARPYIAAMGGTITHLGDAGAGQTVKMCNQLVVALNLQAVSEAIALARAAGVDLDKMRGVLPGSSAASWMLDRLGPQMIAGDASAGFRIDLMFKDLRLVQELAQGLSVPLPGTALVTTQYVAARAHGEGANGNQAIFRVYDRLTNQRQG